MIMKISINKLIVVFSLSLISALISIAFIITYNSNSKSRPEPFDIYISNLQDKSVSISWGTTIPTMGEIVILNEKDEKEIYQELKANNYTHNIDITELQPSTNYTLIIQPKDVDSNNLNDDIGRLDFKTAPTLDYQKTPDIIYGKVESPDLDMIVYTYLEDDNNDRSMLLSSRVNENGNWSIDIGTARVRTSDHNYVNEKFKVAKIILYSAISDPTELIPSENNLRPVETIRLGAGTIQSKVIAKKNDVDLDQQVLGTEEGNLISVLPQESNIKSTPKKDICNCSLNPSACAPNECKIVKKSCPAGTLPSAGGCKIADPDYPIENLKPKQTIPTIKASKPKVYSQENAINNPSSTPPTNNNGQTPDENDNNNNAPVANVINENTYDGVGTYCDGNKLVFCTAINECSKVIETCEKCNMNEKGVASTCEQSSASTEKAQEERREASEPTGTPQGCIKNSTHPQNSCYLCKDGFTYSKIDTPECNNLSANSVAFDGMTRLVEESCQFNEKWKDPNSMYYAFCNNIETTAQLLLAITSVENSLNDNTGNYELVNLRYNECASNYLISGSFPTDGSCDSFISYNQIFQYDNYNSGGFFEVNKVTTDNAIKFGVVDNYCNQENALTDLRCNTMIALYGLGSKFTILEEIGEKGDKDEFNTCINNKDIESQKCKQVIQTLAQAYNGYTNDSTNQLYGERVVKMLEDMITKPVDVFGSRTSDLYTETEDDDSDVQGVEDINDGIYINTPYTYKESNRPKFDSTVLNNFNFKIYKGADLNISLSKAASDNFDKCISSNKNTYKCLTEVISIIRKESDNLNIIIEPRSQDIPSLNDISEISILSDENSSAILSSITGKGVNIDIPSCNYSKAINYRSNTIINIPCSSNKKLSNRQEEVITRSMVTKINAQENNDLDQIFANLIKLDMATRQAKFTNTNQMVLSLFDDINGNGIKEYNEPFLNEAGRVINLSLTNEVAELEFNIGWNLVSFPLYSDSIMKASDLHREIASQGGYITTIAEFNNLTGSWNLFKTRGNEQFSLYDFEIKPDKGYFIYSLVNNKFKYSGKRESIASAPSLLDGWNLVGFHHGFNNDKKTFLLSDINSSEEFTTNKLLGYFEQSNLNVSQIASYKGGKFDSVLIKDGITYGNDFIIEDVKGYFIRRINK